MNSTRPSKSPIPILSRVWVQRNKNGLLAQDKRESQVETRTVPKDVSVSNMEGKQVPQPCVEGGRHPCEVGSGDVQGSVHAQHCVQHWLKPSSL